MNRFSSLGLVFLIFSFTVLFLYDYRYLQDSQKDIVQRQVDIQVNYASDAAVDAMLEGSGDLGLDYAKWQYMKINPQVGLDEYLRVFLRGMSMSDSATNRAMVRTQWIPFFMVASYDGYYMAKSTALSEEFGNKTNKSELIFMPKMPYNINNAWSSHNKYTNLDAKDLIKNEDDGKLEVGPLNSEKQEEARVAIQGKLSNEIIKALMEYKGSHTNTSPYLPKGFTKLNSTNPIENVTVFCYMDNIDILDYNPIDTFGVGAAAATHRDFVAAYINSYGEKVYQYVRLLPANKKHLVQRMYDTAEEAAKAGYEYDYRYKE